jgi:hypothetical protein
MKALRITVFRFSLILFSFVTGNFIIGGAAARKNCGDLYEMPEGCSIGWCPQPTNEADRAEGENVCTYPKGASTRCFCLWTRYVGVVFERP